MQISHIFLNIASMATVCFAMTWFVQCLVFPLVSSFVFTLAHQQRRFLLWSWVLLPWCIAALCSGIFAYNTFGEGSADFLPVMAHWHHLFEFEWMTWHGTLLAFFLIFTCIAIYRSVHSAISHITSLHGLFLLSKSRESGGTASFNEFTYNEIQSERPMAFTAGIFKPECYVSSALVDRSVPAELAIILDHEFAHKRNYDPLKKWLFHFLSGYFIRKHSKQLMSHYALAVELRADQEAALRSDNLDVAATLVAVSKRLRQNTSESKLCTGFGNDFISQRVRYLTSPGEVSFKAPVFGLTAMVLLFAVNVLSLDNLHHYIESLLNF